MHQRFIRIIICLYISLIWIFLIIFLAYFISIKLFKIRRSISICILYICRLILFIEFILCHIFSNKTSSQTVYWKQSRRKIFTINNCYSYVLRVFGLLFVQYTFLQPILITIYNQQLNKCLPVSKIVSYVIESYLCQKQTNSDVYKVTWLFR